MRFPVRFWPRERPQESFQAFASNVSAGGMFVVTRRPLPPRTSVELEVERPRGTVKISAEVVHAARVPPLYQSVFKSGMGLRFRSPDESDVREIGALGVTLPDRGGRRNNPR
ncbi:MAG: PilZ domain-containing protein [Thermoanaerobaculia bacterium]|nr:PilZ domain-containing protein [Thermoanaerobaculia bacterium]